MLICRDRHHIQWEHGIDIYLFNATVFDYNTMKWAVVARIRSNKEDAEFYKNAFTLMFQTCKKDYPRFKLENNPKGIIVDWSDTETEGLRQAIGEDAADHLLWGCNVHWVIIRSYQRAADRVNSMQSTKVQQKNSKWGILCCCKVDNNC